MNSFKQKRTWQKSIRLRERPALGSVAEYEAACWRRNSVVLDSRCRVREVFGTHRFEESRTHKGVFR